MEQLLWAVFGIAVLLVLPTFLIASAAVDLGKHWWRYLFSIAFWPICLFSGLYYVFISLHLEADSPANIWGPIRASGVALLFSLFWTYCFRNVLPKKKKQKPE
ncbi:MAG: hypothetical protein QM719_00520 [Thermomonas sp.]